ncbi:hypothetical protein [Streptomyces syringium]|uniref:hypothetical protein n=1 Tax=Streptomyces syringium TaxID=76729 RepID=UPI003406F050
MNALDNMRDRMAFHLRAGEFDQLITERDNEVLHEAADRIMAARDRDEAAHPASIAHLNRRIGMREAARLIRPDGPAPQEQGGKDTPTGDEFTRTVFFEAGRTYGRGQDGYKAPEQTWVFRCVAVAAHPRPGAGLRAFGFMRNGAPGWPWESVGVGEGEWARGWTECSTGGDADD